MLVYLPDHLPAGAPLVVALHGCNQTAEAFDAGAGWSALAERFGFALLLPEQRTCNNANACFNWFLPGDARRGRGEAGSIRNMVERLVVDKELDRERIFIAGFSAGGAMTSVLLATDPEIFAAGAIIAGLPFGGATNVRHAFDSMVQGKSRPGREWAYFVRRASTHKGPWPRLSVWHGSADSTVQPMNAGEIIKQWTEVHGLTLYPTEASTSRGRQHRVWRGPDGAPLLESHSIPGMGHAVPVASGDTPRFYGATGPFAADVGISSSLEIARFWGLTEAPQDVLASNSQTTPAGAKLRRTLPFGS
jgi:feruloyl esterase